MAKPYTFTARRQEALRKAQLISAAKRHAQAHTVGKAPSPVNRGKGVSGLKKNFIYYSRVNKRGQTVGFNAGTILPKGKKRFVAGGYIRIENVNRKGVFDHKVDHVKGKLLPAGSKRARIIKNVKVTNPLQLRATAKGHQVRLGTSRGAGPTIIVRKGKHKTPSKVSKKGVNTYNRKVNKVSIKKARPQRRNRKRNSSST